MFGTSLMPERYDGGSKNMKIMGVDESARRVRTEGKA